MEHKLDYFMERTDKSLDQLKVDIRNLAEDLHKLNLEKAFVKGKVYGIATVLTVILNLLFVYFKK